MAARNFFLGKKLGRRLPAVPVKILVDVKRCSGGASVLVDAQMRVLQEDDAPATLPVIGFSPPIVLDPGAFLTEPQTVAMRGDLASLHAHDVSTAEIDDDAGDVTILLTNGVRVRLGDESNARTAIPLIEPILTRFALLGRFVRELDLRSPTTPVVTEGAGATESTPAPRRRQSLCKPKPCRATSRA